LTKATHVCFLGESKFFKLVGFSGILASQGQNLKNLEVNMLRLHQHRHQHQPVVLSRKTALQIPELVCVARHGEIVELSAETSRHVGDMRELLEKQLKDGRTYYGINSGFGSLSNFSLPQEQAQQLSRNLITSHSVGAGPKFEEEVVRAAMLIRIKSLSAGHSGVRPAVLELYRNALNRSIFPSVPSQGSLGACGDLAPLSHLALALTKGASPEDTDEGRIWVRLRNGFSDDVSAQEIMVTHDYETNEQKVWKSVPASKVLGDQRLVLESKEGLALNNGATFSAALAALLVNDAERLLNDATAVMAIALDV
jgi:histidine ammonia-lyase